MTAATTIPWYSKPVAVRVRSVHAALWIIACGGTSEADDDPATGPVPTTTIGDDSTGPAATATDATATSSTTAAADSSSGGSDSGGSGDCTFCDGPNEACIDDVCVTTCQGQSPDPCPPGEVCDVISGECHAPSQPCTLAGPYVACGDVACGPGSVCDDQGSCIPIPPCGNVACLDDGQCWGTACGCERTTECAMGPDATALNGPFSVDIGDLEFADDCTAWMVTLRSGTDYVRRLELDGTLTEWAGVANLNMGEIKVLKALTPPAGISAGDPSGLGTTADGAKPVAGLGTTPTPGIEGNGEVAITYTCCPTCGCFVDPPQGVARLDADDPVNPLPIVIAAMPTQGTGPFGNTPADAGPQGLTWGEDRVLYVGNSSANGELNSIDLDTSMQSVLAPLPARITAGAAISASHNLFATEGGALHIYNVDTGLVSNIGMAADDVTALSHDAFSGIVYASLRNLEVVAIRPFTAELTPFQTMPAIGRVSVSPDGQLWYVPMAFIAAGQQISAWDLPDSL